MGRWMWIFGVLLALVVASIDAGDMMRKSIVFNKKTPDVFYCPQRKPTGFDKLLVQARPLSKLCEHEGKPLPADYKSDCYNDVDESEYACKEKYRIMMRLHPPGSEDAERHLHRSHKHKGKKPAINRKDSLQEDDFKNNL